MPSVPLYPQVAPQGDLSAVGATPEAFGVGVGRARQGYASDIRAGAREVAQADTQFAAQLERTSDMLAGNAIKMQERLNQATADEGFVNWSIEQGDIDSKQRSLEGKARADNYQNYIKQTKELREKYSRSMPNPHARQLFDSESRRLWAYSIRNESYGVAESLKKFNSQSNTRIVSAGKDFILGDPENDRVFEEGLGMRLRGVNQEAGNRNWSPEETQYKREQIISDSWKTRIVAEAARDPLKAQELFEKNKDKLRGDDILETRGKIYDGVQMKGSEAATAATTMKTAIEEDIKRIEATGTASPAITEPRVRALLGDAVADRWKREKLAAYDVWWNTNDLATASRETLQKRIANLTPEEGSKDFGIKQDVQIKVQKAINDRLAERAIDPALSVRDDPAVKKADTPQAQAIARMAAQERAGIPADQRYPLTLKEAEALAQPIFRAPAGGQVQALEKVIQNAKEVYGDNWQQAMRLAIKAKSISARNYSSMSALLEQAISGQLPSQPQIRSTTTQSEIEAGRTTAGSINPPPITPSRDVVAPPSISDIPPIPEGGNEPVKPKSPSAVILEERGYE